jgi:CRISPR-associated protein Cas2
MRLFVFFDLPVETSTDRRNYRHFRKFLIANGYMMVQYSVYARILLNYSSLKLQKEKIHQNLPPRGQVRTLLVTDKQFAKMDQFGKAKTESTNVSTTDRIIEL